MSKTLRCPFTDSEGEPCGSCEICKQIEADEEAILQEQMASLGV